LRRAQPGTRHRKTPRSADSRSGWLSDYHAQAEVLGKRIKVPVAVQRVIPALEASGSNHRIDGLANGHAEAAQRPENPGSGGTVILLRLWRKAERPGRNDKKQVYWREIPFHYPSLEARLGDAAMVYNTSEFGR
jgi:hypothetical protein